MTLKQTLASFAGAVAAVLLAACGHATPITSGSPTPAPTITPFVSSEYPTQTSGAQPGGLVSGPDSNLWFTETAVNKIGKLNQQAQVSEFTIPSAGAAPLTIATGPDGALWFTESALPQIGRIATTAAFTEYNLGNPLARPWGITTGPDGALWVTDPGLNGIWRLTTLGVPTFYPLATPNADPTSIATGNNGAVWFLEAGVNKVGTLAVSSPAGTNPTEYPVTAGAGLGVIISGTDNALWFTEQAADKIGRMTTSGVLTSETPLAGVVGPFGLAAGVDGNYYIADTQGGAIAQFIPSTGKVATFKTITANSQPYFLTIGPDSEVYFSEKATSKVGQFRYF